MLFCCGFTHWYKKRYKRTDYPFRNHKPEMEVCDEDYFNAIFNSGLHGAVWPKKCWAILVYCFKGEYYCLYCQNEEGGKHAEELLMGGLWKELSSCSWEDLSTIIIYINFSPCYRCSGKIIVFYKKARARKYCGCMTIVFAAPYQWTGESCVICECTHQKPTGKKSKKMIERLRQLNAAEGIIIRPGEKQDWERIDKNFGNTKFIYDNQNASRKVEDILKKEDFKRALNGMFIISSFFTFLLLLLSLSFARTHTLITRSLTTMCTNTFDIAAFPLYLNVLVITLAHINLSYISKNLFALAWLQ